MDTDQKIAELEVKINLLEQELEALKTSFKRYQDNNRMALDAARRHIKIGGR